MYTPEGRLRTPGNMLEQTDGADYVGPQDDPATLDPEEDRQCQAWWNQIIGATTQETWRKTRSMYEAACRKPLLRVEF